MLALLLLALTQATTGPARVGPLEAWVERAASGACQLRLRNAGSPSVEAWTVTVRSDEARHVSIHRHDGWRDEFHLPSATLALTAGETRHFTVPEDGALGALTVRIHFVALPSGVAYGMPEPAAHVGDAAHERDRLVEARRAQAVEAQQHADRLDAAIARDGVARVLADRVASALLENEGTWNWWRIAEAARAAEARPPGDPSAPPALRAAIGLLREAHHRGMAPVALGEAEPMRPVAIGACTP